MEIQKEKEYLYEMMKEISAERRKLTDIYWDLKKRLDELHNLEKMGLEELSIKGYADLRDESLKKRAIENIQRETNAIIEKIEKDNIIEESQPAVKLKEEMEEDKDKKSRKRRRGIVSKEKQISLLTSVLKDAGMPLKLNEVFKRVKILSENPNLSYSYFQNTIMKEAMERNPKLEKVTKGIYQYRL